MSKSSVSHKSKSSQNSEKSEKKAGVNIFGTKQINVSPSTISMGPHHLRSKDSLVSLKGGQETAFTRNTLSLIHNTQAGSGPNQLVTSPVISYSDLKFIERQQTFEQNYEKVKSKLSTVKYQNGIFGFKGKKLPSLLLSPS